MKRLEKVDLMNKCDADNGNNNNNSLGADLRKSIFRNITKTFRIKSIEVVDNNEFIYGSNNDDIMENNSSNLVVDDDDVFIDAERDKDELTYVADHFALIPGPSAAAEEDDAIFTYDKVEDNNAYNEIVEVRQSKRHDGYYCRNSAEGIKSPDEEKKEIDIRPRRISDVIDCLGEDAVNLRRRSTDSGGITISPRSRTSSDLGYSGSFTSSSSGQFAFSFPPSTGYAPGGMGKRQNDVTDSKPFNNTHHDFAVPEAQMPVERDAEEYNMYHPRRGRAIIINNDTFENNFATQRKGSHVDVANLKQAFSTLGFEVTIYDNWTFQEIKKAIYEISQEDHSDADCLVVAVLTHGMDNGLLYARDSLYPVESLWFPFTADNCLTLAGKPKIFFVQACRGDKLDPGVTLVSRKGSVSETDTGTAAYKIPSYADFLIAYSSMHGFYSWRNPEDGTWFIQSVVEELKKNGSEVNFLELLTRVNRRVALYFSSQNDEVPWLHEQKQVPTFHSTLIRDLIFRPKPLKIK